MRATAEFVDKHSGGEEGRARVPVDLSGGRYRGPAAPRTENTAAGLSHFVRQFCGKALACCWDCTPCGKAIAPGITAAAVVGFLRVVCL
mmetsp:Transcript_31703/g.74239  ORF Transcript_31703/g.74239 Transcript_31703/m.74239 type:complete len:89 (-) Transcript_31703:187-453(-)